MPYIPFTPGEDTDDDERYEAELKAKPGRRGKLRHRCAHCLSTSGTLSVCTNCNSVRYCSSDHQVTHRPQHKEPCERIRKAREKLTEDERWLRNLPRSTLAPDNVFENGVGHFWRILPTRNYMRARLDLFHRLKRLGTLDSIMEAVTHAWDMLRLSRTDAIGIRQILPGLLLQLDRDQQCYDFVKWWFVESQDESYIEDAPRYLTTRNADTFEDVDIFNTKFPDFDQLIAVLLLKLKVLADVRALKQSRKRLLATPLPNEIGDQVQVHMVRSALSQGFANLGVSELQEVENRLILQCQKLGGWTCTLNFHFWRGFFEAEDHATGDDLPDYTSDGDWTETSTAYYNIYPAFWQTDGVLELLTIADQYATSRLMARGKLSIRRFDAALVGNPAHGPNMQGDIRGGRDMWMFLEEALKEKAASST